MTETYVVALAGALAALILIVELLRRRHLTEKYAVIWLVVGVVIVALAVRPSLLTAVAQLVGIAVPSNLLFLGAAFVLLFVCLQLSKETSQLEKETRLLAEEVALLKAELRAGRRQDEGHEAPPGSRP